MTTKHTPGPWRAEFCLTVDNDPFWSVYGSNGKAVLFSTLRPHEELAANTRLIAAAPELLARLMDARDRLADILEGDDGQAWDEASKALPLIDATIAKATGQ